MKARYFRIDAVVRTFNDPDEFPDRVEEVLDTHFNVKDLSVYEVHYQPSPVERRRDQQRKRLWRRDR